MKKMLLVGVRFPRDAQVKIRNGQDGSFVVEDMPIAGPIILTMGLEDGNCIATCDKCGRQSPINKTAEFGGVVQKWAHEHRCTGQLIPLSRKLS